MLGIIVRTFNRKEISIAFVNNLYRQSYRLWELIVCDSGSTDGTVQELENFSQVCILDVGSNNWWTGAVNIGMKYAMGRNYSHIIIMNDDLFVNPDFIEKVIRNINLLPNALHTVKQTSLLGLDFYGIRDKGLCRRPFYLKCEDIDCTPTSIDYGNGCCIASTPEVFSYLFPLNDYLVPHLSGDVSLYLTAKKKGIISYVHSNVGLIQTDATNYFRKISMRNFLYFKGSPFHLLSYLTIGYLRFGGVLKFLLFGWYYHYGYIREVVKFILMSCTIRASSS